MSKFRKNMMDKAAAIIRGDIVGNKDAAEIALGVAYSRATSDAVYGVQTSDEDLNAEITARILAQVAVRY